MQTPVTSSALGVESEQTLLEALARERVGTVLRCKWRLDAVLGVGGFGAVYSATHRTGSVVAVKVLHRHLASSEVMRQRFLREAYLANKVDHPGVVTVLDDDVDDDGVPFMIMTEAIEDYSKAVEYVPVHAIAYFNRGVARQAQGDDDGALLDYGRAIDRQKGFAEPYYNRAGILRSRGQLARAATDAARALELFRAYGREVAIPASLRLLEDLQKES